MKCQHGHEIVRCDCGGSACPGYHHKPVAGENVAGHYCRPPSGEWVKIKVRTEEGEPDA
jgi:hypothetical protein